MPEPKDAVGEEDKNSVSPLSLVTLASVAVTALTERQPRLKTPPRM